MTKEWNGEGLPPIGCECEFKRLNSYWKDVIVIAITTCGKVVFKLCGNDQYLMNEPRYFRPIKSKQEIEREEITEEILDLFDALDCPSVRHVEAICTAGYRNNGEEVSGHRVARGWNDTLTNKLEDYLQDNFKIYPRNP